MVNVFIVSLTRVKLNLENLENLGNRPFLQNVGKPGIVRERFIIFIQVRENKVFSLHNIFINYWHGCSQSHCSNCCQ